MHSECLVPNGPDELPFGSFPQPLLDSNLELVQTAFNKAPELIDLQRSMTNAARLYEKTRPAASKEAAQEAKTIAKDIIHPLFADRFNDLDKQRDKMVKQIHAYRPTMTVRFLFASSFLPGV